MCAGLGGPPQCEAPQVDALSHRGLRAHVQPSRAALLVRRLPLWEHHRATTLFLKPHTCDDQVLCHFLSEKVSVNVSRDVCREPSFCTIAKAEDVKTAEETNGTESPAAPPAEGAAPSASPVTRSAARAAKSAKQGAAAATNGMVDSPGKQANGTATNGAAANGVHDSGVNGSAVSRSGAERRTNGRAAGGVVATKRSPTVLLWRGLVRLGSLLLGPAPEPVATR